MSVRLVSIFFVVAMVSGCSWPERQGGGMDEVNDYQRASHQSQVRARSIDHERRDVLAHMIDSAKVRIETLPVGLAAKVPGRVQLIKKQWGRAARAYAAAMFDDAFNDLALLDAMIVDVLGRREVDETSLLKAI